MPGKSVRSVVSGSRSVELDVVLVIRVPLSIVQTSPVCESTVLACPLSLPFHTVDPVAHHGAGGGVTLAREEQPDDDSEEAQASRQFPARAHDAHRRLAPSATGSRTLPGEPLDQAATSQDVLVRVLCTFATHPKASASRKAGKP